MIIKTTLCWDCKNATGSCSWSEDLKPIKGWKATPTLIKSHNGDYPSYIIFECPEFKRDAYCNGLKRYKENENDTVRKNT